MASGHPDWLTIFGKTEAGNIKVDWGFISNEGDLKRVQGNSINQNKTIYTVPAGKIFYLLGGSLQYRNTAIPTNNFIQMTLGGDAILTLSGNFVDANRDAITFAPTFPLVMNAGSTVVITSFDENVVVNATIYGYELDL